MAAIAAARRFIYLENQYFASSRVAAALAAGVDPRRVWLAVCDLHEIPQERRLGRDVPPKR